MNSSQDVAHQQDYFNSLSGHYAKGNKINFPFLASVKRLTSSYISGDILDVGSGGLVSFDYKKAKSVVLGDIAAELLKFPRTVSGNNFKLVKSNKIKCMQSNVMDLKFKNQSFDVVLMFNVAHHLSVQSLNQSQKNVQLSIKEINRVLKKRGTFIFLDNCPTILFKFAQDIGFNFMFWFLKKLTHKPLPYFLSESQIKKYLSNNGFEIIKINKIDWPKKIYLPVFPIFSPPGWLWEQVLRNRMFIAFKK